MDLDLDFSQSINKDNFRVISILLVIIASLFYLEDRKTEEFVT